MSNGASSEPRRVASWLDRCEFAHQHTRRHLRNRAPERKRFQWLCWRLAESIDQCATVVARCAILRAKTSLESRRRRSTVGSLRGLVASGQKQSSGIGGSSSGSSSTTNAAAGAAAAAGWCVSSVGRERQLSRLLLFSAPFRKSVELC